MTPFSANDRPQRNNIHHRINQHFPESHGPAENRRTRSEKTSKAPEASLIEHILDFLERYPACLAPQSPLSEFTQAC